jgi:hypothetical protein
MHESNIHVTVFSYGSNTHDAMGKVSHSRTDFDVATTTASSWILATTASRWILATTASSRACRTEFQHSSLTFGPASQGYYLSPWAPPAGGQAPP